MTIPLEGSAEEVEVELDELPSGGRDAGGHPRPQLRVPATPSTSPWSPPAATPTAIIFLDDITVSRRHAEIRQVTGGYEVADVGSLNGTYLNRERVEKAPLHDGDELQIGSFKLVFLAGRS